MELSRTGNIRSYLGLPPVVAPLPERVGHLWSSKRYSETTGYQPDRVKNQSTTRAQNARTISINWNYLFLTLLVPHDYPKYL
jgi:hypothetical protein